MSVWLVLPSALPPEQADECFKLWAQQGYKLCIQRDPGHIYDSKYAHIMMERPYKGYPEAVNYLAKGVLADDLECNWIVAAGDDTHPDLSHTAEEIGDDCSVYFNLIDRVKYAREQCGEKKDWAEPDIESVMAALSSLSVRKGLLKRPNTFGVMQPTGDRWGDDAYARAKWPDAPAMIDRICGSPWMGREFCLRINQGQGPLWMEYHHNWADEELQNVAIKYGCFWQRRDLTHYHNHARRKGGQWKEHQRGFDSDYTRMKPLFDARKKMNFPGSEPL